MFAFHGLISNARYHAVEFVLGLELVPGGLVPVRTFLGSTEGEQVPNGAGELRRSFKAHVGTGTGDVSDRDRLLTVASCHSSVLTLMSEKGLSATCRNMPPNQPGRRRHSMS